MTPDVKGLLAGAGQVDPAAGRSTPLGRRTADGPFAILLATATPPQAVVAGSGPLPEGPAPALDVATLSLQGRAPADAAQAQAEPPPLEASAIAELEAALEAALDDGTAPAPSSLAGRPGTPAPGLEPDPARTTASEEELEATESSLPPAPALIPAPAGTGVVLPLPLEAAPRPAQARPPPADPAASRPAAAILADDARSARPGPSHSPPRARPLHEQFGMREGASSERREQRPGGSAPVVVAHPTDPHAPPQSPAAPAPAGGPAPMTAQAPTPALAKGAAAATATATAAARASAPESVTSPGASAEPPETPAAPGVAEAAPRVARRDDRRGTHQDQPLARPGVAARPVAGRSAPTTDDARPAPPPPAAAGQALVRELGTGARMAQASRTATPLREPTAAKGAKGSTAAHPAEGGPPAHLAPQPPPAAAEAVTRPATVPRAAPLAPPEPPQPLPGGTILPHTAHLRLESEALGDLSLHLRVRDGVAHLRVEGEQAGQLAGRGQELQRALAAEGLKLGQLEVERPAVPAPTPDGQARASADQGAPQGQRERAEHDETTPGPRGATAAPPRRPSGRATAHHVEA